MANKLYKNKAKILLDYINFSELISYGKNELSQNNSIKGMSLIDINNAGSGKPEALSGHLKKKYHKQLETIEKEKIKSSLELNQIDDKKKFILACENYFLNGKDFSNIVHDEYPHTILLIKSVVDILNKEKIFGFNRCEYSGCKKIYYIHDTKMKYCCEEHKHKNNNDKGPLFPDYKQKKNSRLDFNRRKENAKLNEELGLKDTRYTTYKKRNSRKGKSYYGPEIPSKK